MTRPARPIRRLLVANRGELVARIARTCRQMGIECLALVALDQSRAWWADQAAGCVPLDGTYLDAEAILRAAREAGADAIHPGYGFLAENADFADAVADAGLVWVGPPGDAMRTLGDKAAGRQTAQAAGVPVLPGYDGEDTSDERLAHEADRIGYPVLVKPSAGGGGKGMHIVSRPEDLAEVLAQARREAGASFGDDRLVLERLLVRPRHVEVQLLVDEHGGAVHLGERDCSLQRRHQKVVEEAPSPAVDGALRERLGSAAVRLATEAGYRGAGTAEFLLDEESGFHFLELNARLQVEHPVTEAITGRDLVADQLRIAGGEPLGFGQADVRIHGHAIQARLYAEDPWTSFLPAAGRLERVVWPEVEGVRVDAGVGTGDEIGTRYDPLLAKLIAHGADREQAMDRLARALEETRTLGVTTNRGFLRQLLDVPEVRAGNARTDTIEQVWRGDPSGPDAAAAELLSRVVAESASPGAVAVGFRLNGPATARLRLGREEVVRTLSSGEVPDDVWTHPTGSQGGATDVVMDVDGRAYAGGLAPAPAVDDSVARAQREHGAAAAVVAPMPGRIEAVRVAVGETVEAGQSLVVLEAMKMENHVPAPASATVLRIFVEPGQQVQRGDPLVELE